MLQMPGNRAGSISPSESAHAAAKQNSEPELSWLPLGNMNIPQIT
jgi:hypothetical protein